MQKISRFILDRGKIFLFFWLFIFLFSALNLILNKNSFETGIGEIEGSLSQQVSRKIKENFRAPFSGNIMITVSHNFAPEKKETEELLSNFERYLQKEQQIKKVISPFSSSLNNLISPDKKTFALMIQLQDENFSLAEAYVPLLRSKIAEFINKNPGLSVQVTGNAAYSYDMNRISEVEGEKAEKKVLLLTFLILLFAFGSAGAAFIAVISGFMASIITISLLKIITGVLTLSVFAQNITSMMGLALGIDYSLLLITRYRQEIKNQGREAAFFNTLKTAGEAVFYSGITVLIGFFGLFLTGVNITFSIGMGGVLVVFFSILIALTFTSLLLFYLDRYLEFPLFLAKITAGKSSWQLREKFSRFVLKNSFSAAILSLLFLLALSYPLLNIRLAEPEIKSMPDSMEAKQGFLQLGKLAKGNPVFPVYLLLDFADTSVYRGENLVKIDNFVKKLREDKRIGEVVSIVSLAEELSLDNYLFFYNTGFMTDELRQVNEFLVSKEQKMTLIQLLPDRELSSYEINRLVGDLRKLSAKDFSLTVGGPASVSFDLVLRLFANFPLIISFIYLVTFILLAYAFKSLLIPIKAILLNSLSVFASYGFLVLVFQYGFLNSFFGITYLPGSIVSAMPVILFCIMFSLSMDYEVFLLSRMYEEYQLSGNNEQAVFVGLKETSGVISKAALIMLIVFGAFVQAEIILIKMSGLGLAMAVLLDATIIRLLLVPAFMKLAGRANWYFPGRKSKF